ncbi:uncharacterized protein RHO17_020924 [Thomomys bottae]
MSINHSRVTEFVLLGLSSSKELQPFLFLIFSLLYLSILLGNFLIILTVTSDSRLHTPMYFLLANLSFIDICVASFATPKMIADFLVERKTISFEACLLQIFCVHQFAGSEMVILVSMAYDRYVAICKPLHYMTIMSRRVCIMLVIVPWCVGFIHTTSQLAFTVNLPFCGPNQVDSFFCDLPLVTKLACIDTYVISLLIVADSGFLSLSSFLLLVVSYTVILITVRNRSSAGMAKARSTLTAHITVVILFFGPCIFIYVWPFSGYSVDKVLAVFYTIFTPILNPVIYTLRNKDMKAAMSKLKSQYLKPGQVLAVLSNVLFSRNKRFHDYRTVQPEGRTSQMDENITEVVKEFVLAGFSQVSSVEAGLFVLFLIFYVLTWVGNVLIMVTVTLDNYLNSSPMYFLLGNLSFLDLCYSTVTTPKLLSDFLNKEKIIPYGQCIVQLFFLHFVGAAEMFLLTVMAYDRYVAICCPLHYTTVMSRGLCYILVTASWMGGFVHSTVQTILTIHLPFCGPNHVDNFFCDVPPVIKLACADTFVIELLMVSNSGLISTSSFVVLVSSYTTILVKIRTKKGRLKALSTCASHLMVVTLFFGPCIFIYGRPFSTFSVDKMVSVLYNVITPMLNPLIYTLRNKEVKSSMKKLWDRSGSRKT